VRVREAAVSRPPIWGRFWRDRRGAVAVAVAILLPILIGFAGLGVEVGLWFRVQRQNQAAADAAAISAALEYAAQIEQPGITTNPTAAAATTANYNLFSTTPPNTLTLSPCYGYTNGSSSCNTSTSNGSLNAVQVVLTQPLNTTFANVVTAVWGPSVSAVNITTTAIAEFPTAGTACLLALDPTAANAVLVDSGTLPRLPNSNCWVASNSSSASALNCNSCTIAGPTTVVGGYAVSNNGRLNGSPNRTYASAMADPYEATLTHTFLTRMPTSNCNVNPTNNFLSANCIIPGGETFSGTITLLPGTYWVTDGSLTLTGRLTCAGCSPGGSGVTIIFTTTQGSAGRIGTLQVPPGQSLMINLNAPGAGTYAGLLMVQDTVPGATYLSPIGTIGNAGSTLSGLIYFPSTSLSFAGNIQTDASNCLVTVARSLSVTGNIGLNDSGCATAGLTTVPTILSVFLVA
jgi:Flp pilus assembly protein TadG